ncbi:MAG: DUF2851 family protein [Melioribacteraceae bacterium]|nr:DUF2851 family protein [Melioribacteraceae bacterium]MCF8355532.1 DUF2851 family protein [Melioribacteraceae bacterium]MCF8394513.1 DUF2851 family protein [Melioribacteraceae bacterium]MCF8420129.1 DUF2851 family protein [Melioribacteraceae bacterium]
MGRALKIYEKQLYKIWKEQNFPKHLSVMSGDDVEVLDIGIENIDTSGPDFKNARIRIGNLTYVGDIEIDTDYRNWKAHGHNIDNKYNKVVLHASLFNQFNQPYVYTKDGRKVPTLCLSNFINNEIRSSMVQDLKQNVSKADNHKLRCNSSNGEIDNHLKEKFVSQLGIERFKKKSKRIYDRLKELKFLKEMKIHEPVISYELTPEFEKRKFTQEDFKDREIWEQLFYELIFEALGYSKNKSIMQKLAQSANIGVIKMLGHDDETRERIESLLFNIAGLAPDTNNLPNKEISDYALILKSHWDIISRIYDGEIYDETKWHFFKLRPQNFPTIRIAGGTKILLDIIFNDLIGKLIKKFTEIRNLTVLINSVRSLFVLRSDGFWQKHYVFNKPAGNDIKYFVGASRADEIVINVVLPYLLVYFDIFNNEQMSKKVIKIYSIYQQRSDNKIVREVGESLGLSRHIKRTIYSQGLIELFRSYCSQNKCLECEIGKIVFN